MTRTEGEIVLAETIELAEAVRQLRRTARDAGDDASRPARRPPTSEAANLARVAARRSSHAVRVAGYDGTRPGYSPVATLRAMIDPATAAVIAATKILKASGASSAAQTAVKETGKSALPADERAALMKSGLDVIRGHMDGGNR
jgi:hypothetical protein